MISGSVGFWLLNAVVAALLGALIASGSVPTKYVGWVLYGLAVLFAGIGAASVFSRTAALGIALLVAAPLVWAAARRAFDAWEWHRARRQVLREYPDMDP